MSTVFVDHYEILGVPPGAPPVVVHSRYIELAQLYHPDILVAHSDATEHAGRFAAITHSYSIIKEPKLRQKYDSECKLLKKIALCAGCDGTGVYLSRKGFDGPYVEKKCKSCSGSGRK